VASAGAGLRAALDGAPAASAMWVTGWDPAGHRHRGQRGWSLG